MSCDDSTCSKHHIQNPSTLECVDKNSILGMWILKLQSEAQNAHNAKMLGEGATYIELSQSLQNSKDKEELHLQIKEEFQDINDKLENLEVEYIGVKIKKRLIYVAYSGFEEIIDPRNTL
jgi:hypothetical protein